VGLADVVGEVGAHQRQAEDRDVERLVVEGDVGDVAGDHALVDRDVVEAVDRVLVPDLGGDQRLAAAEVADDAGSRSDSQRISSLKGTTGQVSRSWRYSVW
jgi:hypothetical protein